MATILEKILANTRRQVADRKTQTPLEALKAQAQSRPRCRHFYRAVTQPNRRGLNVIAEVKKASPSAGLIRPDFDPVRIAQTYEACGADAISVLTDETFFQGRLEYLTAVKEAVKLPVLRKDFIVDPYQVYEARAAGADAILLIADALTPSALIDLLILASDLTLTTLIEVHQADTLLQVRSLLGFPQKHYSVLGINNRDLQTMKVDINTTGRLAGLVEQRRELIAESGIRTREDVQKLIRLGIGGVLIGQTLCAAEDIAATFAELFDAEGR